MEKKDIIKISITSLILGVLTSFVYPQGAEFTMPWPVLFNFILEIFYYTLVISFFESGTGFTEHLIYAGGSFFFRVISSMVFAAAVTTAQGVSFPRTIVMGMIGYLPHVYVAILVSPWVLLSFMKDSYREKVRRIEIVPLSEKPSPAIAPKPLPAVPAAITPEPVNIDYSVEGVLDYIRGIEGVYGCALTGRDGLLIDYRMDSRTHAEDMGARMTELYRASCNILKEAGTGTLRRTELMAEDRWISLYGFADNLLMVVSGLNADDKFSFKMERAIDVLKTVFRRKYKSAVLTEN